MATNLEQILNDKREANKYSNEYRKYARIKREKSNKQKRRKIIVISILVFMFLGFIYIPQFFIADELKDEPISVKLDSDSLRMVTQYAKDNPSLDFDKDGIVNSIESDKKINIFNWDCDGDYVLDGVEASFGTNPLINDTTVKTYINEQLGASGQDYKTPFSDNGCILWASDLDSRVYGSITKTFNGNYRVSNFKGYIKFPDCKQAYKYENGIHSKLKYNKENDCYYVDGDYEIVAGEELKMTNVLTLFNKTYYISDNIISNALSFILPDKGFITSKMLAKIDTDPADASSHIIADIQIESLKKEDKRFGKNDIDLSDLTKVKEIIDEGTPIYVSLLNPTKGEFIAVVYGYTENGNLLICDAKDKKYIDTLVVKECSGNYLNKDGSFVKREWYEFSGLGFNSKDGDRISFLNNRFYIN